VAQRDLIAGDGIIASRCSFEGGPESRKLFPKPKPAHAQR
jgi:hypothetical protein